MKPIPVTACSIFHVLLAALTAASTNYDHYLLSCGASSAILQDGRMWYPDNSTFSSSFSSTTAAAATTRYKSSTINLLTARVFTSRFTYSFPVSPGPKFIRLFFYASTYSATNLSVSAAEPYLTITSNSGHLLLYNFSAYLSGTSSSDLVIRKEFYVHVNDFRLQLSFSPTPPSLHAFVNGIEVVSVPENLYVGPKMPTNVGNNMIKVDLGNWASLETCHRVNVGGKEQGPTEDSGKMYRTWSIDDPYLIDTFKGVSGYYDNDTIIKYTGATPNYTAPAEVYETIRWMGKVSNEVKRKENVTWRFLVDLGFHYLVRLHWCELEYDINSTYSRVFDVYFNDIMAEKAANVLLWVDPYTPVYRDYWLYMDPGKGGQSRGTLNLTLRPNSDPSLNYLDILLNGLEIFKVNRSDGSLNVTNPSGPPFTITANRSQAKSASHNIFPVIIGVFAGAMILSILVFYLLVFRGRKVSKTLASSFGTTPSTSKRLLSTWTTKTSRGGSSSLPTHLCRHFTLVEIRLATSDFSDSLIVGHGGFGNVYKCTVVTEAGPTTVAIKRLNPLSNQGVGEFKMEIELLSKLRHVNLVSLIGYCDDAGEMILVYEYMSRGTLRDQLYSYNSDLVRQLSWHARLEICIGAARGLHYLHNGIDRMIIHRDIKSTNILLDDRWTAKVSDFGLSKLGPVGGELSHVSTAVKGSFGYLDPEYYRRQQLTEKSDVYSFGVVLFEVLCGRPAVNLNLPKEQVNLPIWGRRNQMSGTLDTIVDPTMRNQIAPECLRKFGEVAESCVRDEGVHRPSMGDVIKGLELALQLQLESSAKTTTDQDIGYDEITPHEEFHPINISSPATNSSVGLIRSSRESTWMSVKNSMSGLFSSTTSEGYGKSPAVFSQIFQPEGR